MNIFLDLELECNLTPSLAWEFRESHSQPVQYDDSNNNSNSNNNEMMIMIIMNFQF